MRQNHSFTTFDLGYHVGAYFIRQVFIRVSGTIPTADKVGLDFPLHYHHRMLPLELCVGVPSSPEGTLFLASGHH